jgi:hypothetical protein
VVQLTTWGQTALAADHLLFPELNGFLPGIVAGVIRQLTIRFVGAGLQAGDSPAEVARKIRDRQYAYETLLETAINFCGLESRWLDAAERPGGEHPRLPDGRPARPEGTAHSVAVVRASWIG